MKLSGVILLGVIVCILAQEPSQIRMSLSGRADERVVMWTSEVNSTGSVMYWEESAPGMIFQESSSVATYTFPGYTIPYFHTAMMRNLKPNTGYGYIVQNNGVFSSNYSFKTESSPENFNGLKILMMGDMGSSVYAQEVANRIEVLKSQYAFDFVLYAGDLSYAYGNQDSWDVWQDMIAGLTPDLPWMFSVGNHEQEDGAYEAYQTRFTMPANASHATEGNLYYSYDYENVHVIVLNSMEPSFNETTPQRIWLENDLGNVDRTRTPWVIATWHKPWYCSSVAHAGEGELMRQDIEPLLYQYGVDFVLNGHVHSYERVTNMYNNSITSNGIVYLNVGSGGHELHTEWNNPQPDWSMFRNSTHGVGIMTIYNSTTVYWEFIQSDGEILDTAWIYKSTVTPSVSPTPLATSTPSGRDSGSGQPDRSLWILVGLIAGLIGIGIGTGIAYMMRMQQHRTAGYQPLND